MRAFLPFACALAFAVPAAAHQVTQGDLTLTDLQVRASLGQAPNTAGYLTIRNAGHRPDRLLSASCTCAARVELHAHQMRKGVARMVRVRAVAVPSGGEARLAPGGAHLMLFGLKQPVLDGTNVPMTLVFQRAGRVSTNFHVRSQIGAAPPEAHAH